MACASISPKTAATAAGSAVSVGMRRVRTRSAVRSDVIRPIAEATPAARGITTVLMPKVSASSTAWRGPAPPKATRVKSRGSIPRCTVTTLMAAAMLALATLWMACAAVDDVEPEGTGDRRLDRLDAELGIERDAAGQGARHGGSP